MSSAPNFICALLARRQIKVKLTNESYFEVWTDNVLNYVKTVVTMKGLLLVSCFFFFFLAKTYYSCGRALHSISYSILDCLESFMLAGLENERQDGEYSTCEICMDNM